MSVRFDTNHMYRQYGELNQRINLLERLIEDLPEEGKGEMFISVIDDEKLLFFSRNLFRLCRAN